MHTGKMAPSTVKYKVLATDVRDENDNDYTEDEDDGITIDFQSPFFNQHGRTRKRDTCIRVTVAVVLLGIVFGFVIYEWNYYWPGIDESLDLSNHQGTNKTNNISENEEHKHHHEHHQDDGDHNDHDHDHDHDHKEGDDHDHHHNDHDSHTHEHSQSLYHNAAIITDSANCSSIGKELLQESGNVVDAGIAALLCLGVVHPHTAGLGGVFSAILYNHTTRSFKAIHDTSQKRPTYGAPSLLQGLRLLHSEYGQLEWSRLFEGAVKLAKEGFLIDEILSRALETHKDKILQSRLCDVFCDKTGRVKSEGEHVTNGNLSELLLSVSVNSSHFPENVAVKLAQDISEAERPAFLAAAQASSGEINEPLIMAEEKYSILSATNQLTGRMVSNILNRVREQNLTFPSHGDHDNAFASYNALLKLANEFFNTTQIEMFTLNITSSHIGILDSHGDFIVISTSLNSTWGSGKYLPSSGVILNEFTSDITQEPYFAFPLVLSITDEVDDPEEKQFVAVTGGLSALLHSVVMLTNLADVGLSAHETVSSPLLHIEQWGSGSWSGCVSGVTNNSVFRLFSEEDRPVEEKVGVQCSDCFLSMILRLNAEHVGAYGAPAVEVQADGY